MSKADSDKKTLSQYRINSVPRSFFSPKAHVYGKLENLISNMIIGDKLPSERNLSEILECSRGTLRDQLLILEVKGYLFNSQGKSRVYIKKIPKAKATK